MAGRALPPDPDPAATVERIPVLVDGFLSDAEAMEWETELIVLNVSDIAAWLQIDSQESGAVNGPVLNPDELEALIGACEQALDIIEREDDDDA